MSLNIKNERVHDLARQAAVVTGKTQTGAVEEALERLLADYGRDPQQLRAGRKIDLVRGIVLSYAAEDGLRDREVRSVEDLYDADSGLPQ